MSSSPLISVLALIVTLGVLITVHEFGHFWVARRLGVKVHKVFHWLWQAVVAATEPGWRGVCDRRPALGWLRQDAR